MTCLWFHSTYDLQALRRQAEHGGGGGLAERRAASPSVFLHHVQKLIDEQVDPQALHPHWLHIKGLEQGQDSILNLLEERAAVS